MPMIPDLFSLKTAWRDARSQYRSLILYCGGIVAGVAALVAILSFRSDILLTVEDQAKELLGADLEISQIQPFDERYQVWMDSVGGERAYSIELSSMILYRSRSGEAGPAAGEKSDNTRDTTHDTVGENILDSPRDHVRESAQVRVRDNTRLSQIRAIGGDFPFYGSIKTDPPEAARTFQQTRSALVDRSVMRQFGLSVGDSIRVGMQWLPVSGKIIEVPGESAAFSLIGPRVMVPYDIPEEAGLLTRGSRVRYKAWFRFDDSRPDLRTEADRERLAAEVNRIDPDLPVRVVTVASRKQDFAEIVDNMTRFLGMVGFVALMLGALGVASAVHVYIKRKSTMIATLRCLGASSRQTIYIFTIQVIGLGLVGATAGSLLGLLAQRLLPLLFVDFLPFDLIQQISTGSVITGFLTGTIVSFSLALLPLMSINNISPLLTIQTADRSPIAHVPLIYKITISSGVIVLLTAVLAFLLDSLIASVFFVAGIIISFLILWVISSLLVRLARALRLHSLPYVWRQGIANLFRPNNQTTVLVTTLGMGMLLMGSMYLSKEMIIERIRFLTGEHQPNLVFYDIQADQIDGMTALAEKQGATVLESVPIVSMRLSHINDQPVRDIRQQDLHDIPSWVLTREYRVTYRDHLTESETLREGEWIGRAEDIIKGVTVPVSLDYRLAHDLGVALDEELTFDVQGVPLRTRVASIRDVDFQRPQPNFFLLFPAGVLEGAPRFYATTMRTPDEEVTARVQREVVQAYPNISAIDVGLVLESVQSFLDKIAMAVQFMALFSILTGLIVMASAIAISRYQRMRESVLLRTIGASRRQIRSIHFLEYFWLGSLAGLAGLLLATIAGWLIAWYYFELVFVPDFQTLFIIVLVVTGLTLAVGFLNFRPVLYNKPLEILRMGTD